MKAIVVSKTGGPEVLELRDHDPGAPAAGQVRVKVGAVGVNYIDVYFRTGLYPRPLPFVAGLEGAGTVEALGPDQPSYAFEADGRFATFKVAPVGYRAKDLVVEADASTATYFAALAAITRGRITMLNLAPSTRQPDYGFLEILERLGCTVERRADRTTVACSGPLRGGFSVDMRPLSDAALTLAAIAPFADAAITITGVAHIRHHESDRIAAACRSLAALGVPVEEHPDGLTVSPAKPRFATLDTYEDHRVAMAFAVLGAGADGVELLAPSCVSKTCPTFFEIIAGLGVAVTELA